MFVKDMLYNGVKSFLKDQIISGGVLLRHCCMKCPQILREKTSSEKHTVISLKIQWKVFAAGNALTKPQHVKFTLVTINAIIVRGQNYS